MHPLRQRIQRCLVLHQRRDRRVVFGELRGAQLNQREERMTTGTDFIDKYLRTFSKTDTSTVERRSYKFRIIMVEKARQLAVSLLRRLHGLYGGEPKRRGFPPVSLP